MAHLPDSSFIVVRPGIRRRLPRVHLPKGLESSCDVRQQSTSRTAHVGVCGAGNGRNQREIGWGAA